MKLGLAAALVAAFYMLAGMAQAEERQKIMESFDRLQPSVGALYTVKPNGTLEFTCSVTAIDNAEGKTVVLTALHCVRQKNVNYKVTFSGNVFHNAFVWKLPPWEADADRKRKRGEPEIDMALMLVDGADVGVIPIDTKDEVKAGQKIAMVGFPLGVSKISYEGIVSGRMDRPGDDLDGYILLQIFGAPGSSGSSVYDAESGKIIGILVQANQSRVGLPVIFATPIAHIDDLELYEVGSTEE